MAKGNPWMKFQVLEPSINEDRVFWKAPYPKSAEKLTILASFYQRHIECLQQRFSLSYEVWIWTGPCLLLSILLANVWERWLMEATITAVKPFLMDILKSRHVVKLKKKNLQCGVSLYLGVILSGSLKCRHLHIPSGHVHWQYLTTTRQMHIYLTHKTVCHCCWIWWLDSLSIINYRNSFLLIFPSSVHAIQQEFCKHSFMGCIMSIHWHTYQNIPTKSKHIFTVDLQQRSLWCPLY